MGVLIFLIEVVLAVFICHFVPKRIADIKAGKKVSKVKLNMPLRVLFIIMVALILFILYHICPIVIVALIVLLFLIIGVALVSLILHFISRKIADISASKKVDKAKLKVVCRGLFAIMVALTLFILYDSLPIAVTLATSQDKGIRYMDYDDAVKVLKDAGYSQYADENLTYYYKDGIDTTQSQFDVSGSSVKLNTVDYINNSDMINAVNNYFNLDSYLTYDIEYEYNSGITKGVVNSVIDEDTYKGFIDSFKDSMKSETDEYMEYNKQYLPVTISVNKLSDVIETDDCYAICDYKDYGRLEVDSLPRKRFRFKNCLNYYFFGAMPIMKYHSTSMGCFGVIDVWHDAWFDYGIYNKNGKILDGDSVDSDDNTYSIAEAQVYDDYDRLCSVAKYLDKKGLMNRDDFAFKVVREYTIYILLKGTQDSYTLNVNELLGGCDSEHGIAFDVDDMKLNFSMNKDICSALISTFKYVNK